LTYLPDTTSVVQIGAIPFYAVSKSYDLVKSETETTRSITVKYNASSRPNAISFASIEDGTRTRDTVYTSQWGALSSDVSDPKVRRIDVASSTRMAKFNYDNKREMDVPRVYTTEFYLEGFSAESPLQITAIIIAGVSDQETD
jgi:hypothetical protein